MSVADGKEIHSESAVEDDRQDFCTPEAIAELGWETHRAWERIIGDPPTLSWEQLSDSRRQEIIDSVKFIVEHPTAPVSAQHDNWRASQSAERRYGDGPDSANMVPFDELPWSQQKKAVLWRHIVHAIIG